MLMQDQGQRIFSGASLAVASIYAFLAKVRGLSEKHAADVAARQRGGGGRHGGGGRRGGAAAAGGAEHAS